MNCSLAVLNRLRLPPQLPFAVSRTFLWRLWVIVPRFTRGIGDAPFSLRACGFYSPAARLHNSGVNKKLDTFAEHTADALAVALEQLAIGEQGAASRAVLLPHQVVQAGLAAHQL